MFLIFFFGNNFCCFVVWCCCRASCYHLLSETSEWPAASSNFFRMAHTRWYGWSAGLDSSPVDLISGELTKITWHGQLPEQWQWTRRRTRIALATKIINRGRKSGGVLRSLEKAKIEGRRHSKRWDDGEWEPNTCYRTQAESDPIGSDPRHSPNRMGDQSNTIHLIAKRHIETEDKQTNDRFFFFFSCIQLKMQNSFQWRRWQTDGTYVPSAFCSILGDNNWD